MNPFLGLNSVIVLDNCSTHKSEALREVVEASGEQRLRMSLTTVFIASEHWQVACLFSCLHTPPTSTPSRRASVAVSLSSHVYSLRLTLITVKKWLCRHWWQLQQSEYPEQDLREACFIAVTAENARGWYRHSGYFGSFLPLWE